MKDVILVVLDVNRDDDVSAETRKKPFVEEKPVVISPEVPVVLHSEKGHYKHGFNRVSNKVITQDGRR